MCVQEAEIVEYATKKWVPVFKAQVEKQAAACIRQLRTTLSHAKATASKYKFESGMAGEAQQLLDEAMIMISEALLAHAMTLKQASHEVQGQLKRMQQQGIGQVCHPLLTAANKIVRGG